MDRSRKRKADASGTENGDTPSKRQRVPDEGAESAVTTLGLKLIAAIRNAKDKSGRTIADLFLELPRRKDLPDYYDIIKLPIAVSTVEEKLRANGYNSLTEVESDFKRMIANAKLYNDDGSVVYTDAERVRKLLHNWMKTNNPDHKKPDYIPFPTPIPDEAPQGKSVNGDAAPARAAAKEESRAKRPTITLSKGRSASDAKVASSIETNDPEPDTEENEFEGKTFGQVQEMIIEEFIQWRDEDDFAEFQPFINLPSRSLTDYYQLIRKPMCLRLVAKRAKGQHGKDGATGVTDFKTWDAFEDEVSLIWKNAHTYNEDGSDMFELASRFKDEFLARLAEVKAKVDEPQSTRIKLNARPKAVLHLGSKSSQVGAASPGISVDGDGKSGMNGHQTPLSHDSHAAPDARNASTPPVIKTERSAASPALEGSRPGTGVVDARPSSHVSMLPPGRVPSASPYPSAQPAAPPTYIPPLAQAPATFAETFPRTRPVSEALLPSIHLCSHPQLSLAKPFKLDVPASPDYTQQSLTVMLPVSQYHLQVSPTVSQQLASGRQYKLFVSVNGIRSSPSIKPVVNGNLTNGVEKKTVYDVPLGPGVNRIEVEIVAVPNRAGALEVEKTTVFANLMRY